MELSILSPLSPDSNSDISFSNSRSSPLVRVKMGKSQECIIDQRLFHYLFYSFGGAV